MINGIALVALLIFISWLAVAGWHASRRPKKDAKPSAGMVPSGPSITVDGGGTGC